MPRAPRFIPANSLVEITMRTIDGRFLLRPCAELNERILGILGRALFLYPVALHAFVFLSNHWHALVTTPDAKRLSSFLCYVNSNIAKAAQEVHNFKGSVWARRAETIVVVDDGADLDRLRYVLAHGAKEGLVASPLDWPGVSSARAIVLGEALEGRWRDRTLATRLSRSRSRVIEDDEVVTCYPIHLAPLPSWSTASPEQRRAAMEVVVRDIEREARVAHPHPCGPDVIRAQSPFAAPAEAPKGPAPRVHARTKAAATAFVAARSAFINAYRAPRSTVERAAVTFAAHFPCGAFPPPPPLSPFGIDPDRPTRAGNEGH
jgi:hypothetical protein